MSAPDHLRVEHLQETLGLGVRRPRLSWRLPAGSTGQLAYRIRTGDGVDTGWVRSDQSVLVPYPGPALGSAARVEWQVQVETDLGPSAWSVPAGFETGLLDEADWQNSWVGPGDDPGGEPGKRPAQLLRAELDVTATVASARLSITAHGIYETWLNGRRVGADELAPGFTQYDTRLAVQTYDVSDHLRPGRDAIGVILADGWLATDTEPSWLVMVDRGATTVWERWNGVTADGVPSESLNHYSKGAVVSFLHRYVAGLQLLDDGPAYRRFRIRPRPGGGLSWVEAAHESPYGRIEVSWRRDRDQLDLTVTIPPGTTAEVVLPDGTTVEAGPGRHGFRTGFR